MFFWQYLNSQRNYNLPCWNFFQSCDRRPTWSKLQNFCSVQFDSSDMRLVWNLLVIRTFSISCLPTILIILSEFESEMSQTGTFVGFFDEVEFITVSIRTKFSFFRAKILRQKFLKYFSIEKLSKLQLNPDKIDSSKVDHFVQYCLWSLWRFILDLNLRINSRTAT